MTKLQKILVGVFATCAIGYGVPPEVVDYTLPFVSRVIMSDASAAEVMISLSDKKGTSVGGFPPPRQFFNCRQCHAVFSHYREQCGLDQLAGLVRGIDLPPAIREDGRKADSYWSLR